MEVKPVTPNWDALDVSWTDKKVANVWEKRMERTEEEESLYKALRGTAEKSWLISLAL